MEVKLFIYPKRTNAHTQKKNKPETKTHPKKTPKYEKQCKEETAGKGQAELATEF